MSHFTATILKMSKPQVNPGGKSDMGKFSASDCRAQGLKPSTSGNLRYEIEL